MKQSQIIIDYSVQPAINKLHGSVQVERNQMYEGYLILINGENPIRKATDESMLVPLSSVPHLRVLQEGMLLENTCLQQLVNLLQHCQGLQDIVMVSGFRSMEEQQHIYETSLRENGAEYTASYVALPNQSEHQTGLAIDVGLRRNEIDFIAPSFPSSGVCQAFKKLAADYGFIQRYKEGKEFITNIACEPWHFRYVGYPHAAIMEQHGFCLEEYINFLRKFTYSGEQLCIERDGLKTEIYFVPAEEGLMTTIPLVKCDFYQLSGNNKDGFIITAFHRKGSLHRECFS
ncbi:D-alanyl-D-alanine dipeptidase/carboxypeptidase [Paenibacillus castaneae]|uniref:M15 family metallopeptidase n=1 Tax=Paenibacillus castaneae TaxID=474957 RepID=UPI001FBBB7A9|nr:M15 family metallopeptidase [Paenibacillus castaneae]NIK76726.1 D-alanyl-D-alanine dipeptidase/carboxypeptidase [Paenibacillus castaneae]